MNMLVALQSQFTKWSRNGHKAERIHSKSYRIGWKFHQQHNMKIDIFGANTQGFPEEIHSEELRLRQQARVEREKPASGFLLLYLA